VNKQDLRDQFILGAITAVLSALWVYLFKHPDPSTFTAGVGASASILGLYHWFVIYDSKREDAQ
jgi:hypothetical protein